MNRIKSTIWVLRGVFAVLVAVVYARKNYEFKRRLAELRRSARTIDANLAEIQRLGGESSRIEQAAAARARREFEDIDFTVLAERLQLVAFRSRRE